MTARRLPRIDVVDSPLVARLARKYGRQRPAIRARDAKQVLVGLGVAVAAGLVAVKVVCCVATMIP